MSRPDVSVIIVSYNTRALTLRCLSRLLDSRTADVSFDVTVVDNASADGSADAIAEAFAEVRLIRLTGNVGWGRAVNRGAVASAGGHLLLMNPDAAPVGSPVADLCRFARRHPRHGIYTGRTLRADGTDDTYCCWGLPSLRSYAGFATGLSAAFPKSSWTNPESLPEYDRRSVREVPAVSGCCMLIERGLFNQLGGFDPQYFLYSDDIDLCTRAAALGASPVVVPDAAVIHIGGASSSSEGQRIKILRGKATYVRRHWSPPRARLALGLLMAGVGLRAVGQAALGLEAVGKAGLGLRTVGQAAVGLRTVGRAAVGLRTVGQAAVGLRTVGRAAVGLRTVGRAAVGLRTWATQRLAEVVPAGWIAVVPVRKIEVGRVVTVASAPRGVDWRVVWRERPTWSAGWPAVDEPRPPNSVIETAGRPETPAGYPAVP